jgi:hypothetical protein
MANKNVSPTGNSPPFDRFETQADPSVQGDMPTFIPPHRVVFAPQIPPTQGESTAAASPIASRTRSNQPHLVSLPSSSEEDNDAASSPKEEIDDPSGPSSSIHRVEVHQNSEENLSNAVDESSLGSLLGNAERETSQAAALPVLSDADQIKFLEESLIISTKDKEYLALREIICLDTLPSGAPDLNEYCAFLQREGTRSSMPSSNPNPSDLSANLAEVSDINPNPAMSGDGSVRPKINCICQ